MWPVTARAFWHGLGIAESVYHTEAPEGMDIVIGNARPKDVQADMAWAARVPMVSTPHQLLRDGGTFVAIVAAPPGNGFHDVQGPGTIV